MNDPIVPPILPPSGKRLDPKTLRVTDGIDDNLLAVSRGMIRSLTDQLEAEQHRRRAAELRAVDRFGDGLASGVFAGGIIGAAVALIVQAWF